MIRYNDRATLAELRTKIGVVASRWLGKAKRRTRKFIDAGKYDESSGIWSDIKSVYMTLQFDKCGYCERHLADGGFGGAIEHDVEHYRPKNTVPVWPHRAAREERDISYTFDTGSELPDGYYWLAYHPLNYCTSCKKCNSPLKGNYFPVATGRGSRNTHETDPNATETSVTSLNDAEKPFLIYPIGEYDEDPEDLITFVGITAIPKKRNGPRWRRARITIDFFELNGRSELREQRARQLVSLDNALFKLESSDATDDQRNIAREDIKQLRHASSAHASCVRAACVLYQANPTKAREVFAEARTLLRSLRSRP